MGSYEVPHKIWARSVKPFCRLLDTNGQSDNQSIFIDTELQSNSSIFNSIIGPF